LSLGKIVVGVGRKIQSWGPDPLGPLTELKRGSGPQFFSILTPMDY